MDLEHTEHKEAMEIIRENLQAVETDRENGLDGISVEELDALLDAVINQTMYE